MKPILGEVSSHRCLLEAANIVHCTLLIGNTFSILFILSLPPVHSHKISNGHTCLFSCTDSEDTYCVITTSYGNPGRMRYHQPYCRSKTITCPNMLGTRGPVSILLWLEWAFAKYISINIGRACLIEFTEQATMAGVLVYQHGYIFTGK